MPKYTVAAAMVLLLTACNTVTAQKLKTTQDSESKIEMIEGPVVEQPKLDLNKPFPEGNSVMTAKPVLCSNVTELLGRHKTLPLPSIVKITNLENGLFLNIKIVDRHDDNASIIQVSRKVAQLLKSVEGVDMIKVMEHDNDIINQKLKIFLSG